MRKTALKRGDSTLKRGMPLRKVRRDYKYVPVKAVGMTDNERMNEVCMRIWNSLRPSQRVCYETGQPLYPDDNGFPLKSYFHHVLAKEVFPQFAFSAWNIILVSVSTHSQVETGIRLCPKIHALTVLYKSKSATLEA